MSTGQLVFYGGAALLAATILLAVVFLIHKPVYTPEKAVYDGAAQNRTQTFRSGYPTDPLTVRRDSPEKTAEETLPLTQETAPLEEETVPPAAETVPLPQETVPLTAETVPLSGETVPLAAACPEQQKAPEE